MADPILVDLFAEDNPHEKFLLPLVQRIARDRSKRVRVSVRSARGGHGRVLSELEFYQEAVAGGLGGMAMPDMVVIGIDGNCQPHNEARKAIIAKLNAAFRDRSVIACPAPHVERWFLADVNAFASVVGSSPKVRKGKCQRDYYKCSISIRDQCWTSSYARWNRVCGRAR